MAVFRDETEKRQTWTIRVTFDSLRRVRELTSVDLTQVIAGDLLGRLAEDVILLCDVLYALCKPEADSRGFSDTQFGELLYGDVIEAASAAMMESLVEFFPSGKRAALKKMLAQIETASRRANAAAMARLDDPALNAEIDAAIDRAFGDCLTSLRGLSASTPPLSPSGN